MATKKTERNLPESWEEFCEKTGRDPKNLPDVSAYADEDKAHAIADFKLVNVIKHCNGGNIMDTTTVLYEPWFRKVPDSKRPSGLGLSYDDFANWWTLTLVGPRLCFVNYEDMLHVTKYFKAEYEDLLC